MAPRPSILGTMRLNNSRLNYYIAHVYLTINGVRKETSSLIGTLTITKRRGPDASFATFRVKGFTPTVGQSVVIGVGSLNHRQFGGRIQRIDQPKNATVSTLLYDLTCIGYRWLLDRRLVYRTYTNTSVSGIVTDLIGRYTSGFTTAHVTQSTTILTSVSFDGQTVGECLDHLKTLVDGFDWYVDDYEDVHAFEGHEDLLQPNPVNQDSTEREFGFLKTIDLSQVRTRVYVDAPGSRTNAPVPAGSTVLPVEDLTPFDSTGGSARSGAQQLTYTSLTSNTRTGSILDTYPGTAPPPAVENVGSTGGGLTIGAAYRYAVTWITANGESTPTPMSPALIAHAGAAGSRSNNITRPTTPGGATQWNLYRTMADGTALFKHPSFPFAIATASIDEAATDGNLTAQTPPTSSPLVGAVGAQIAVGATSIPVVDVTQFSVSGGVALVANQIVTYTGLSQTVGAGSLTGIPASGPGSIQAVIPSYTPVTSTPALLGVPASSTGSIVNDLLAGDEVNPYVQRDDAAAQAALAAVEGGDGIREHDLHLSHATPTADMAAAGDADLARFTAALTDVQFASRDDRFLPGTVASTNMPSPNTTVGDFLVQEVVITQFEQTLVVYPLRTIHAADVRFTLTDLLRKVG
jgi:hypothetical protein